MRVLMLVIFLFFLRARVTLRAQVSLQAQVTSQAQVSSQARVFSRAQVFSRARVAAVDPSPSIVLNQAGFYAQAPKLAIVILPVNAEKFYVVGRPGGDTAFSGLLGPVTPSSNSALSVRAADFSALNKEGSYTLVVPGLPHSLPFVIGRRVYGPVAAAALKGYYYQRASMALTPAFAGVWARAAGHPDGVVFVHPSAVGPGRPAGTVIASPGGWYDAGDYNKYVVNSGITMGTLFDAYEDFPALFDTLSTNIPLIKGLPDILNEALYNLRWMLTMQDPGDGGVYHKCTNAAFDGMVKPGVTRAPRYVVQKSTAATLDLAAVMAQASRIFAKFPAVLPGLADSCLRAARSAWSWALQNPAVVYDQEAMNKLYQPAVTTGAYGDAHFDDERFWAATELFLTTREEGYGAMVKEGWRCR
jgi:endoglucanase